MQPSSISSQPASITWLNMSGDVTITWDDSNKAAVLALVEQKLKQGYSFFVLTPRPLRRIFGDKKERLTSAEQLAKATAVVVADDQVQAIVDGLGDPEVQAAVKAGHARLAQAAKSSSLNTVRRAATASEVLVNQTVAVRPVVGG